MKSDFLTQKLAFEVSKLLPGTAVQLITASHMPGESPRTQSAIIKNISPFSIRLLLVGLGEFGDADNFTGKVEEKEFPIESFEGVGSYTLKRLYTEADLGATKL